MPNITTLANLKEYLGISDVEKDMLLENMIARMSRLLEAYWGATIGAADYDHKKNGQGTSDLLLSRPINSITSLYQSLDQVWDSSTLIASADYLWDPDTGIVHLKAGGYFLRGFRNVRTVYNAGYASIPGDVEQIVIRVLAREYRNKDTASDWTTMTLKDGSITRKTAASLFGDDLKDINLRKNMGATL